MAWPPSTGKGIGPCGENAAKAIGDGFAGEDPGLRDERSGSVRVDVLKRFHSVSPWG